jgi:hypothetical protein
MKKIKNIKIGKAKILFLVLFLNIFIIFFPANPNKSEFLEIKILDKVSSKSSKVVLPVGIEKKFKNLIIKSLKCKNSEFDDNPEITAYLQVKDSNYKDNDEVFVFNGWTFASSPSLIPFDHPVYDICIIRCY